MPMLCLTTWLSFCFSADVICALNSSETPCTPVPKTMNQNHKCYCTLKMTIDFTRAYMLIRIEMLTVFSSPKHAQAQYYAGPCTLELHLRAQTFQDCNRQRLIKITHILDDYFKNGLFILSRHLIHLEIQELMHMCYTLVKR